MDSMAHITANLNSPNTVMSSDKEKTMSDKEFAQLKVDTFNNRVGDMKGYDCPICKNKGYIMRLNENFFEVMAECECMKIRKTISRIEKSGLKYLLKDYTFEKYIVHSEWQKKAKAMAMEFLSDYQNKWFFAGGQVGCGKDRKSVV